MEISHRNVVNNDTSRRNPVNTENNSSRSQENDGAIPNASNVAAPYLHDHIDEDGRNVRVQAHPSFATPASKCDSSTMYTIINVLIKIICWCLHRIQPNS